MPAGTAGKARWRQAQAVEARYWDGLDVAELLRIASEKPAFLALISPDRAAPFVRWIDAMTEEGEYLQRAGEDLDARGFDTVISYNVLDHVRDPMAVLACARAALEPGGTILVGVDCLSVAGRARFEHVPRRLARGSILVEAHPHSSLEGQVRAMMASNPSRRSACRAP